jgi:hypothetical protein
MAGSVAYLHPPCHNGWYRGFCSKVKTGAVTPSHPPQPVHSGHGPIGPGSGFSLHRWLGFSIHSPTSKWIIQDAPSCC